MNEENLPELPVLPIEPVLPSQPNEADIKHFAVVESNVIVNVACAVEPLASNWESLPEGAGIGWRRASKSKPFLPPASAPAEFPRFVGNAKLDLFTQAEQLAVVTATMADPMVKLMYDRLLGAAYLSYEDPETEQGLALLMDKGLLTPERKAEIVQQMQPR